MHELTRTAKAGRQIGETTACASTRPCIPSARPAWCLGNPAQSCCSLEVSGGRHGELSSHLRSFIHPATSKGVEALDSQGQWLPVHALLAEEHKEGTGVITQGMMLLLRVKAKAKEFWDPLAGCGAYTSPRYRKLSGSVSKLSGAFIVSLPVYCRGLDNVQYHFEVYLKYLIL